MGAVFQIEMAQWFLFLIWFCWKGAEVQIILNIVNRPHISYSARHIAPNDLVHIPEVEFSKLVIFQEKYFKLKLHSGFFFLSCFAGRVQRCR
jgi:hypothetical protein